MTGGLDNADQLGLFDLRTTAPDADPRARGKALHANTTPSLFGSEDLALLDQLAEQTTDADIAALRELAR
jgi:hypothetical protein